MSDLWGSPNLINFFKQNKLVNKKMKSSLWIIKALLINEATGDGICDVWLS